MVDAGSKRKTVNIITPIIRFNPQITKNFFFDSLPFTINNPLTNKIKNIRENIMITVGAMNSLDICEYWLLVDSIAI